MQNILIWLSGRAVKTQLQIVLIRLFARGMDIQFVLKMDFKKLDIYPSPPPLSILIFCTHFFVVFFCLFFLQLAAVIRVTFTPFLLNFLEFFGLAIALAPFLRRVWAGFREREGFESISPSLQAYAELQALTSGWESISP